MKNNKLISVILVLLVCLSMVVSASAASDSDLSFTLESDSSVEALGAAVVNAGDTFTVKVNIEKNPGILISIASVEFDSTKLELTSGKALVEGVRVPTSTQDGRVKVVVGNTDAAFTPDKFEPVSATGSVAELTFKVLEKTDIQTSVTVKATESNTMDKDGKYHQITVSGGELKVNVVSADHKCDPANVIDLKDGKDATCTEEGSKSDLLCAHCGKVVTEGAAIPALGHNWGDGVITTEPTCTEMGVRTYTCANCGETKTDDKIPAIGHNFGEWKVTKEATVEAEGEETRTCANCQETESRAISKLTPPPTEPTPPAKKSNTGLIIGIVVVVVLAGAGVAAYFVLKNKKK